MQKPALVVCADWSKDNAKRWMTRAELCPDRQTYCVFPPEPVGEVGTLLTRLAGQCNPHGTVLLGLDFPIGLPRAYAELAGLRQNGFRHALEGFGREDPWRRFYEIGDTPDVHRPFYPPPTQEKGKYPKQRLFDALGLTPAEMLRHCDRKTANRREAGCLFFTLGGNQVGPAAINGWSTLLAPALSRIRIWPFDGDLSSLLIQAGIVVAEIYPAEAYRHIGLDKGLVKGKRKRESRRSVAQALLNQSSNQVRLSNPLISWIEWGFCEEDDFDATVGLLSMLQVVTGNRTASTPVDTDVRRIEGWILGQEQPT